MTVCKDNWCIFFRLTTYNVIAVIGILIARQFWNVPEIFLDIVRATSLSIALSVLFIHVIYGPTIILDIYNRVYPIKLPIAVQYMYDFIIHILPVFIIGVPYNILSIMTSIAILWVWYGSMYSHIQHLYTLNIPMTEYNAIIFIYIPILMLVIYLLAYIYRNY